MSSTLTDAASYSTLTSPEFDALAKQSLDTILARQATLDAKWDLGRATGWSCDQDAGTLQFTYADGTGVEASVQILGSYASDSQSWEWGWNNPSVNADLNSDAQLARMHGEIHGFGALTTGIVRVTPEESRLLIAVAAVIAEVEGVYWAASGPYVIAMGYRDIRAIKATEARVADEATPQPRQSSLFGAVSHYWRDPLVLMRRGPKPAGGLYVRISTEDEAHVTPALLDYLTTSENALVSRGFAAPLRVTSQIGADIKSIITMIEHPLDGSIAYILISVGRNNRVSIAASFRNDFASGIQMYTTNSRTISRTPSRRNTDNARFPDVSDVGALYDIHRARVTERARKTAKVPLTRGLEPLVFQDAETRAIQAFWVHRGYYRWADGDMIELTRLGALLSALRGLYPWKQLTEWNATRKAAAIRRRLL